MKYLKIFKIFERRKVNNIELDDIVKAIKYDLNIYTTSIDNYPDHNPDNPVTPVDITNDQIYLEIDGENYTTDLKYISEVELPEN